MKYDRKLNSSERAMELLNRYRGSWSVITISCIRGNLDRDILQPALDIVRLRHPRLRSIIVDRGSIDKLYFVEQKDNKIPLEVIFQEENESWQDIVSKELNEEIDSSKSLIECFLIRDRNIDNCVYFVTKIHHAICDALSTVELHSEIIQNCHKIAANITIEPVAELPAVPPLELLLPKWMNGFSGKINELLFGLKLQLNQKKYALPDSPVKDSISLENNSCGLVHKDLNSEVTTKLIQLCRQEKASVHSALCAAMLFAKINDSGNKKINLICNSYVDLRRRALPEIGRQNLAFLASFIVTFYRVDSNISFWDLARKVYRKNNEELAKGEMFKPMKSFKKVTEGLLANYDKVNASAGVTNIGRVTIPQDYGSFQLESISFLPTNSVFSGFLVAAVTTYKEKMLLNFTFSRPSISQQQAENMAEYSMNLLTEICLKTKN